MSEISVISSLLLNKSPAHPHLRIPNIYMDHHISPAYSHSRVIICRRHQHCFHLFSCVNHCHGCSFDAFEYRVFTQSERQTV
jgi:hypothetical protein